MRLYAESANVQFKYAKGMTDIYGKTFHESFELFLLVSGNVEFVNEHTRVKLVPYQLVVIPKGSYHQFLVKDSGEDYERFVLNAEPQLLGEEITDAALGGKEIISLTESHRIVRHLFYLKDCISHTDKKDFSYILDAVATDMVFIIKSISSAETPMQGSLHSVSVNVMTYINGHFSENLGIEMLALRFHVSYSSLCHVFKEDFGISIKKYIMQKRMSAAHSAIASGMPAQEAAAYCGYQNYSAFYRCYVNYFGKAPSKSGKPFSLADC